MYFIHGEEWNDEGRVGRPVSDKIRPVSPRKIKQIGKILLDTIFSLVPSINAFEDSNRWTSKIGQEGVYKWANSLIQKSWI
jgi:hypothetical protein